MNFKASNGFLWKLLNDMIFKIINCSLCVPTMKMMSFGKTVLNILNNLSLNNNYNTDGTGRLYKWNSKKISKKGLSTSGNK